MTAAPSPSLFTRLLPKSLVGQLLLATAIALFVAQAVSFILLARGQAEQRTMRLAIPAANRIIDVSDRLAVGQPATPLRRARRIAIHVGPDPVVTPRMEADLRTAHQIEELLEEANLDDIEVRATEQVGPLNQHPLPLFETRNKADERVDRRAERRAERRERDGALGDAAGNTLLVSAQVRDGQWVNLALPVPKTNPMLFGLLGGQTILLYLLLLAPIAWIGWRVSRPLKSLTEAARARDLAAASDPVPESGPADVSDLTRAFNTMRARIFAMLGEKDRMLGALGHDLRTPLASLRVRVESVDDDALRTKMIATMDEMAVMLDDILALARLGQAKDAKVATDVPALLSAVVEDYRDMGADVRLTEAPDALVRALHTVPMRRALRNLIDNALNYGKRARVSLATEAGSAVIRIADDGPGIAPDRIAEMMEPFARAEQSRSRETGGAGLGLALAKSIIEQQGGQLRLLNAPEGGLIAEIILG